jgi:hypothetical protein
MLLGRISSKQLTEADKLTVELLLGQSVSILIQSYRKAVVNRHMYHSDQYDRITKRCNSIISLKDNTAAIIVDIVQVTALYSSETFVIFLVQSIEVDSTRDLPAYEDANCFHIQYVSRITNNVRAVRETDISSKCAVHKVNGSVHAMAKLPNTLERD